MELNLTYRPLRTDDIDQYNDLLRYSFQITEQDLAESGWKNDEIKQSKFPVLDRADVIGCFDGQTLASQFAVYPLKMNIYGQVYAVGFVTSVCTYPEYSGKGIMKQLMYRSLAHIRSKHEPFALLYPYSIPLYRRRGWEIISNKISYIVKDRQITTSVNAPGMVHRVEWDDQAFMNLHNTFAQATHGCLFRNSIAWEEYWRWEKDDTFVAVYYDTNRSPQGYMVYLVEADKMYIKEMIYLNREAQEGLWKYIREHDSMIDEVHGDSYCDESIAFEMDDADIKETIHPYIMGRIVDVEMFFEKYSCRENAPRTVVSFVVEDNLLEWNNGTFRILLENGTCTPTQEAPDMELKLSIGSLTTMLIGYKRATELHRIGRIKGSLSDMERLDEVLLHQIPYISDYI